MCQGIQDIHFQSLGKKKTLLLETLLSCNLFCFHNFIPRWYNPIFDQLMDRKRSELEERLSLLSVQLTTLCQAPRGGLKARCGKRSDAFFTRSSVILRTGTTFRCREYSALEWEETCVARGGISDCTPNRTRLVVSRCVSENRWKFRQRRWCWNYLGKEFSIGIEQCATQKNAWYSDLTDNAALASSSTHVEDYGWGTSR